MFSASKRLSKDKLNGPEGVPLVGTYDLTPLAALPPQEYLLQASLLYVSTGTRSQRWTMGQLQHRKNVSLKASLPTALR